jgi:hypothetical protein
MMSDLRSVDMRLNSLFIIINAGTLIPWWRKRGGGGHTYITDDE